MDDSIIPKLTRRDLVKRTAGAVTLSALVPTSTLTAQSTQPWPSQPAGGRIHALPGINIWGSDSYGGSGRNPASTGVDILLVDNLASTNTMTSIGGLGSNVYHGTLEGALRFNAGTRSKQIIICSSGTPNYSKSITSVGDNWSLWGQFAPSPGLWPRGLRVIAAGRDHWQVWHVPFYLGEDVFGATEATQAEGDPFRAGSQGPGNPSKKWLFVCCEFSRGTDELFDAFQGMDEGGFVYCAFLEAVGYTNSAGVHRTQYGPLFGGSGDSAATRLSIERSFFAHNTARNPYMCVREATLANNLLYNLGRLATGGETVPGIGPLITNQFGFDETMHFNLLRSMIVRGPDNGPSISGVHVQVSGNEYPSGSGIFIAGCVQHGWTNPSTQSGFLISNASSVFEFKTTVRTAALPPGRLTSFTDTKWIAANPASPTQTEKQTFFDMIAESVGVQPSERTTAVGRVHNALNQCDARLNGNTSTARQLVKNSAEAGGWWTLPTVNVNPASPGAHWHQPMPTAANRHTPLGAGTFSNGQSAVGYTPMEVWAIEQHYYRGGR